MQQSRQIRRWLRQAGVWLALAAGYLLKAAWWLARAVLTSPPVKAIGRLPLVRRLRRSLGALARPIAAMVALLAVTVAFASLMRPAVLPELEVAGLAADDEAVCLALNIYHEARGEPDKGKLAVGHVVLNRMRDTRFPDKICQVIRQGGEAPRFTCQFSWWCDGKSDRPDDRRAWADSQAFAAKILAGKAKDPTGGALWYHADYVAPSWGQRLVAGPRIGRHKFYLSN